MRRLLPIVLLIVMPLGAACFGGVEGVRLEVHPLVVGNHQITAEVAYTPDDRRHGLMSRESLPDDHGMLFVFPAEKVLTFWMKDTPLPLSIAFADAGGKIVRIADLEPHSTAPVASVRPAQLALEMSRGWFDRHGVLVGDEIRQVPDVPVR